MSKEMNEQLLRLREKVLQAELERLEGAKTFSIAEARKCLRERNKEEVHNLVLGGLEQIKQGKTKDFDTVCDRVEKKYIGCKEIG